MRPFLKWAGGKYRLVERIKKKLPPGRRLLEPFAGSCALALNTDYSDYWLNDINPDLIALYQVLQSEGLEFIDFCRTYFEPRFNTAGAYYDLRSQFNRERNSRTRAALFLYLNRHGYNGLSRYNSTGEFNVPFGRYKQPYFPEAELAYFHQKLKNARFSSWDFETMMLSANAGDVIYCDPPYVPLNPTSNFTAYSAGGFGEAAQRRLARVAAKIAANGVTTIISNHHNEFVSQIYKEATLEKFPVRRFISCDGANRREVEEVLAIFG